MKLRAHHVILCDDRGKAFAVNTRGSSTAANGRAIRVQKIGVGFVSEALHERMVRDDFQTVPTHVRNARSCVEARNAPGKNPKPRRYAELVAAVEQNLHTDADSQK